MDISDGGTGVDGAKGSVETVKNKMWDLYGRLRDKSPLPRLAFYIGLTIELLIVIMDKSSFTNPIEGWLFRVTFLLFAAKLFFSKYELREWALIFLLEGIALISYLVTGENELIRMVTFVAACRGISLREALRYTFYVTLAGCLCIVVLSVTGIYGDVSLTQAFGHESPATTSHIGVEAAEETRYTLGMGHPNALSCMAFMLTALGVYVWFDRIKWYGYLLLLFLHVGVYLLTRSKTGALVAVGFLAGACLMHLVKPLRESNLAYLGGLLIFLLCIAFSVDAAVCAQRVRDAQWNEFFYLDPRDNAHIVALGRIDRHLSGRIVSLTDSGNNEGMIHTWYAFSSEHNMNYYFDMGWVKVFYRYGVIPGSIYVAAHLWLLRRLWKRRDACGLVLFVMFAVYTVAEAHLVSVYLGRNYLLLFMGVSQDRHL